MGNLLSLDLSVQQRGIDGAGQGVEVSSRSQSRAKIGPGWADSDTDPVPKRPFLAGPLLSTLFAGLARC